MPHNHPHAHAEAKAKGVITYLGRHKCSYGHKPIRFVKSGVCVKCQQLKLPKRSIPKRFARSEAKAKGLTTYVSRYRCPKGHPPIRWTSTGSCVRCIDLVSKKWKQDGGDEFNRQYARARYWKNPQKYNKASRAWRLANPELSKKICDDWIRRHPESRRIKMHRRRALLRNAKGSHTIQQIRALLKKQNHRCPYCSKSIRHKYHIDHRKPLARGGSNGIRNIQLLCVNCNGRKHTKTHAEFKRILQKESAS